MGAVETFLEVFNRGEVPPLGELATPGYTYAEPWFPGPYDAGGHEEIMRQVLEAYPDRRIDVTRVIPGADGAVLEATWSGTPNGGGERLELELRIVVDLEPDQDRISRFRSYYDSPDDVAIR